jgi:hypothetical protein
MATLALPAAKERTVLMSLLNPFADLPYLVVEESILYERVQTFASTTSVVTALLCGISGSALLQEVTAEEQDNHSPATIRTSDTLGKLFLHMTPLAHATPLKDIKYAFLCFSFLCNAQGMLLSSLVLTALNSTPSGYVRHFVTRNSMLVSALGWSLVPGTLSLCAASAITAKLMLSYPLDDMVVAGSVGILTATFGVASLLLLQNHRLRSQLIKHLVNKKNTKH